MRPTSQIHRSIRRHLVYGVAAVVLLCGGVGGWATTTELAGAVIAQGQLVVDSYVKKVQHPTGGVVGELRVHEGQQVKAGDILLRLDETQIRAQLQIILRNLDEMTARQAREEAERDGEKTVNFEADLLARLSDPGVARLVQGERKLFDIRSSARAGQKSQLKEQIAQIQEQIKGLTEQVTGKGKEIEWVRQELKGVRELWEKNLVQFNRVTALERDAARLDGERGSLIAGIAQAKGKMAETELRILQVDEDMRSEVGKDLAQVRASVSELREKRIATEDQLKRVDIRAPQDGFIHQLSTHTVGGVIDKGEVVAEIVPEADRLIVEAKVRPQDRDQLRLGQAAVLRFSAFNQGTTPELNGVVSRVSADVTQDTRAGTSFYTIRVRVPPEEIGRLGNVKLEPGMPVDVYVQTTPRTVLSYLVRPMHDQIFRAFRER